MMPVSYYTTCSNRWHQLRQTLRANLNALRPRDEIVILDYGSTDGLIEGLTSDYMDDILSGKLVVFQTEPQPFFDVAVAKNLAARLSSKPLLFNLDADNWIEKDSKVLEIFHKHPISKRLCIHETSGVTRDGSYGRLLMSSGVFHCVGGYRERMLPIGFEDNGLILRLKAIGITVLEVPYTGPTPITNTEEERSSNTPIRDSYIADRVVRNLETKTISTLGPHQLDNYSTHKVRKNFSQSLIIDGFNNIHEIS